MDELKLNLSAGFMRSMIAKIIARAIRKKLGCDIDILINNISVQAKEGKIRIHADLDAETSNENFIKMIKTIGWD